MPSFTQLHRPPFLAGPSLSGPRLVGAPRKVAFFTCPDESFPLRSPEVSPHSIVFFLYPDRSSDFLPLQLAHAPCDVAFFPTQQALARPLTAVYRPHARPCYAVAFHTSPLLLRHTAQAPTPRVLQRWLYQPRQQTQRRQGPRPWQVQRAQPPVLPLIRACQCLRVPLPLYLCRPSRPCQQAREGQETR